MTINRVASWGGIAAAFGLVATITAAPFIPVRQTEDVTLVDYGMEPTSPMGWGMVTTSLTVESADGVQKRYNASGLFSVSNPGIFGDYSPVPVGDDFAAVVQAMSDEYFLMPGNAFTLTSEQRLSDILGFTHGQPKAVKFEPK